MKVPELKKLGFDGTYRDGKIVHLGCSQCNALFINGVPCHEIGCMNEKKDYQGRKKERA